MCTENCILLFTKMFSNQLLALFAEIAKKSARLTLGVLVVGQFLKILDVSLSDKH